MTGFMLLILEQRFEVMECWPVEDILQSSLPKMSFKSIHLIVELENTKIMYNINLIEACFCLKFE